MGGTGATGPVLKVGQIEKARMTWARLAEYWLGPQLQYARAFTSLSCISRSSQEIVILPTMLSARV